jgi:predicted O-methyltransferase YrrM
VLIKKILSFSLLIFSVVNSNELQKYWCARGHFNIDQADFFKKLSEIVKPKFIIETGFCTGRSAASLLTSNKNISKFISIDIDLNYMQPEGKIYASLLMKEFPNFFIIEEDSSKVLNDEFFKNNFPNGIDWATIDGDHSYEGCSRDLTKVSIFLNYNGIIIIDDYKSGPPNGVTITTVTNAVNDFAKQNPNFYKIEWNKKGKGFCIFTKSLDLFQKLKNLN